MIVVDEDRIVKNPLVSVRVHSYNQEQYIEQCLDSILAQNTSFEYEIVLANNPSDDRTRDICIRYQQENPCKIKLLLRDENMGFFANFYETGKMCRGKYIARCDADDYWCDENKLQKQVDYLECHEEIGLCYTGSKILYDKTGLVENAGFSQYAGNISHLTYEPIMTLTVMHRRKLYEQYVREVEPQKRDWLMEDTPISLWYSFNSKISGINDITTVYRIVDNSISHPVEYEKKQAYNKSLLEIRLFYYEKYIVNDIQIRNAIINDYYRRDLANAYSTLHFHSYIKSYLRYRPTSCRLFFDATIRLFKLGVMQLFL